MARTRARRRRPHRASAAAQTSLNRPTADNRVGASLQPDACANIVMNRRKPVARFLNREELERLGAVLDRHAGEHLWPVAAIRLLT